MTAPFLSYHAAMAGLANMAAAITPTETSLLICSSPYDISGEETASIQYRRCTSLSVDLYQPRSRIRRLMTALGHQRSSGGIRARSAHPRTTDMQRRVRHVGFVPCVDGSGLAREIFTSQAWSVLPCVRPVDAVHMTAGHNALRGSGPGQQHAFDDAMAQVGCPDRRIDRLCITCCSPSQPSPHAD